MSQAPMPLDTTQGYAPPIVTQFSVFLPNKVGKLLDLVESFDGSTCSICAPVSYTHLTLPTILRV